MLMNLFVQRKHALSNTDKYRNWLPHNLWLIRIYLDFTGCWQDQQSGRFWNSNKSVFYSCKTNQKYIWKATGFSVQVLQGLKILHNPLCAQWCVSLNQKVLDMVLTHEWQILSPGWYINIPQTDLSKAMFWVLQVINDVTCGMLSATNWWNIHLCLHTSNRFGVFPFQF